MYRRDKNCSRIFYRMIPSQPVGVMKDLLLIWYFLMPLIIKYSIGQNQSCETTENISRSTIIVSLKEASLSDLYSNPDEYLADTKINGIIGSSDLSKRVNMTMVTTPSTPSSFNLTQYFKLESRVLSTPENGYSERAFIRLIHPLDRDGPTPSIFDDMDVIMFQIICKNPSEQPFFYLMTVSVQDVNDNNPIFVGSPYETSVNELSPVGTTVFNDVSASDLDSGSNKEVQFSIVPGTGDIFDGSKKFTISNPVLGIVVISSILDFEELNAHAHTYYILNISATDQAIVVSNRKTSYTQLRIDISDGNDLPPAFEMKNCFRLNGICFNPVYTTQLTKNAIGSVLLLHPANSPLTTETLAAYDQDTLNASIIFSVEQTIPDRFKDTFSITRSDDNGKLYFATLLQIRTMDKNTMTELEIIIKATELSNYKRYERAVVKVVIGSETVQNTSCPDIDKTKEQCENLVPVVGGVLGSLLAIITVALIILYLKHKRIQHPKKNEIQNENRRAHTYQNDGADNIEDIASRSSSRRYEEIGTSSPSNEYDELQSQYIEL